MTLDGAVYVYAMGLADDRDRTRLYRLSLDGTRFTPVASSVIRKSVEGLQMVGVVHRNLPADAVFVLALAQHGGLDSVNSCARAQDLIVWAARARLETLGDSTKWEWFLRP